MTEAARAIDILLVDDHRVFAEVMGLRLRQDDRVGRVSLAFGLSGARALLARQVFDVVLLDLNLDEESGLDLLEDIGDDLDRNGGGTSVVVLSASQDPDEIVAALRRGVSGWVSKNEPFQTILAAALAVWGGDMHLPSEQLRAVVEGLMGRSGEPAERQGFLARLSPREFEVLQCLVAGMSRAEVAERLFLSTNTVRTHVQKVLRAAEVHSTIAAVAEARRLGVDAIDVNDAIPAQRTHH